MKGFFKGAALIASVVVLGAFPASAHHSFSMFDKTKQVEVKGTISLFQWMNPHTYIWIFVPDAQGKQVLWAVEGVGPNDLRRLGWDKHTLNPGDVVTIKMNPLKDGRPGGSFLGLTLANGKVLGEESAPGKVYGNPDAVKPTSKETKQ